MCEPRGFVRQNVSSPRGRILSTNRPFRLGAGGVEIRGSKPRIIATIKIGSRRMADEFRKAINRLGLDVARDENGRPIPVQTWDFNAAFDVAGFPEALEEFTALACVKDWHFATSVTAPRGSQIAPLSQRSAMSARDFIRKPRPKPEAQEREYFARLGKEDKEDATRIAEESAMNSWRRIDVAKLHHKFSDENMFRVLPIPE